MPLENMGVREDNVLDADDAGQMMDQIRQQAQMIMG
jgi:hypothetical protein